VSAGPDLASLGLDARGLPAHKRLRAGLEIGPVEARGLIAGEPAVLLVDVREPDEWKIGRIDGAVLVPLGEVEERADELLDALEEAGGDAETTPVVVYCHHGVRSLTATAVLQAKGLRGARSMAGGIDLWSVAVDPAVVRY
jgi:rhodanese-related sulfurtransferase